MQSWLLLFRAASLVELLRHLSRCCERHGNANETGVAPKKQGRFPHSLKTKEATDETESARLLLRLLLSLPPRTYTAAHFAPLSPTMFPYNK